MESVLELRLTLLYRWRAKKLAMTIPTIAPNTRPPTLDPTTTPVETPECLGEASGGDQPDADERTLTRVEWKDMWLAHPLHCAGVH